MVHPRDHGQLAAPDPGRGLPVGLDQRRIVRVADQERRRHRDLAKPTVNRRILLLHVTRRNLGPSPRTQLFHDLRGGAGASPDALQEISQSVHVPGIQRALILGVELIRFLGPRVARDTRAQQDERGHPGWLLQGQPERGAAALAATHERGAVEAVVAEHRDQVGEQGELRGGRGRPAEAAGVVPDDPVRRG